MKYTIDTYYDEQGIVIYVNGAPDGVRISISCEPDPQLARQIAGLIRNVLLASNKHQKKRPKRSVKTTNAVV